MSNKWFFFQMAYKRMKNVCSHRLVELLSGMNAYRILAASQAATQACWWNGSLGVIENSSVTGISNLLQGSALVSIPA